MPPPPSPPPPQQRQLLLLLLLLHPSLAGVASSGTAAARHGGKTCVLTDYNASGDGRTFDTAAIDAALHDCSSGGVVILPGPNTFLTTGGHRLHSNMGFEIQAGAVLLQTPDQAKGSAANASISCGTSAVPPFAGFASGCAVLSAQNASNVSIYGAGAIRGAGSPATCWNWNGAAFANLLKFRHIDRLRISGVRIENPCGWTIHPQQCQDVHIHDIAISCEPRQYHYNTDGIDPDSCVDVLIEDVDYSCGDDAVAVKASYPGCQPTSNITIRRLASGGRGGFTIGSEIQGGASDITFEDCTSTGVSGIRISRRPDSYLIANLHTAAMPGLHWVCRYVDKHGNSAWHDPLARLGQAQRQRHGFERHVRRWTDEGPAPHDQEATEDNCGQRCLGALCVAQTGGFKAFLVL